MTQLIIAEKPSVARDIAKVLGARTKRNGYIEGKNYWITWCFGHMVRLVDPAKYNGEWKRWTAKHLPMLPDQFKLEPIGSSSDQFKILKGLLNSKEISGVVNACDAGREGELIFRYVYDLTRSKKPVQRLWLASMTDAAIKQAFKNLKPGTDYDALADAARSRSEADWLVGMNATRALTLRARRAGGGELMSIGRVQTPTLALIVSREREIEAFKPEPFWQVFATFDAGEQPEGVQRTYEGLWTKKKIDRFQKKEDAQRVLDEIEGKTGEVVKVVQKDIKQRPPYLFDLTSLQREANRRFGYSAKQTLDLAQKLYEQHKLITYPRTDSNYLTTDMKKGLPGVLQAISTGDYQPFCDELLANTPLKITKRIVNDKEVGDHHAIIPTDKTPNLSKLDAKESKIYDLIARRFIASFYPDAVFATTKIATAVEGHIFVTSGKVRKEAGWQEVEPPSKYAKAAKGKGKKKPEPILPAVTKGDQVPVADQRLHAGMTQPPKRFSESMLLGAMERAGAGLDDEILRRAMKESGLGTPATRASVIETLLKRQYISRKGKVLVPSDYGRALIDSVPSEELKSASLTGQWESKLSQIADGKTSRADFMKQVREMTASLTSTLLEQEMELADALKAPADKSKPSLGKCPICKTDVTEGHKAYSCQTGRDCSFVIFKRVAGRSISPSLVKLLLAGKRSKPLKGFRSKKTKKQFQAALELDEKGTVKLVFDNSPRDAPARAPRQTSQPRRAPPREQPPTRPTCPACEQGSIIEGKKGWGCSRWREGCRFVVWYEQAGHKLDADAGLRLFHDGDTGALDALGGKHVVLDLEAEGNVQIK